MQLFSPLAVEIHPLANRGLIHLLWWVYFTPTTDEFHPLRNKLHPFMVCELDCKGLKKLHIKFTL